MRPPPPEVGVAVEAELAQSVAEGVITLVIVPPPEYARVNDDADPVHVLLETSLVTLEESCCKVGDVTVREEPEARVTEKFVEFTTMDCIVALEPEMSSISADRDECGSCQRYIIICRKCKCWSCEHHN
jgi:hypothetical protein